MKKKPIKIIFLVLFSYVFLVILFESTLGYFQPENASTLQISTLDSNGELSPRIVARLESGGQLYVAANHWPRAWYREALANPRVQIDSASEQGSYTAVPVEGEEHERVDTDNSLGLVFRILTGFPPRYFLRLDPAN
ncbi:MAG: nitroreductase/quinone reductase family protein [Pseudohongiellaceae bacterium]